MRFVNRTTGRNLKVTYQVRSQVDRNARPADDKQLPRQGRMWHAMQLPHRRAPRAPSAGGECARSSWASAICLSGQSARTVSRQAG
jgi:hypothetical protein